jgi:hypothetical protein
VLAFAHGRTRLIVPEIGGSRVTGNESPGWGHRVGFWVFLGLVSAAIAEVTFPNTPFDIGTVLFVLLPVYFLHSVVLAGVVYRYGSVSYRSLYLAGVLFGLWETYITKVAWAPVGEPIPVEVAGVHVFETLSLVLFWHPLVAFVLPVVVVERLATDSRRSLVPPLAGHGYAPHLAVAAAGCLAVFQGSLGRGPSVTLLSNVVVLGVLLRFLWVWRRTGGGAYSMESLLPGGWELRGLAVALVALYPVFGATLRPSALPESPGQHAVVVGTYLLVGAGFLTSLGTKATPEPTTEDAPNWSRILGAAGAFVLASLGAAVLMAPFGPYVFLAFFSITPAVGIASLAYVGLDWWRETADSE